MSEDGTDKAIGTLEVSMKLAVHTGHGRGETTGGRSEELGAMLHASHTWRGGVGLKEAEVIGCGKAHAVASVM